MRKSDVEVIDEYAVTTERLDVAKVEAVRTSAMEKTEMMDLEKIRAMSDEVNVAVSDYANLKAVAFSDHAGSSGTDPIAIKTLEASVAQGLHGKAVLDLGCAMGKQLMEVYLPMKPSLAVGLDLSSTFVEMARAGSQENGSQDVDKVRFEQADLHNFLDSFPDLRNSFDVICSCFVIHYCTDLVKVFTNCRQSLRSDGKLVFLVNMVTNPELPPIVQEDRSVTIQLGEDFFVSNLMFTKQEYLGALEAAGFDTEFTDFGSNQSKVVRDSRNANLMRDDGSLMIEVHQGLFVCRPSSRHR